MLRSALRWSAVIAVVAGVVAVLAVKARAETTLGIAHYIMGVSHEFEDQLEAAAEEYQQAALADPSSFAAHMRLGVVSAQLGDNFYAVKELTAASRLKPDDLQARYLLALAYTALKDYDHAAEQYEVILKGFTSLDPKNAEYYIYLSQLYYSQGKISQAVAQFEKLLALQPKNTDALLQVGAYYLEQKRRPEGLALLKRCIEVDPAHADCLNALGYAYAEDGVSLDEARGFITRALSVEPGNAAFRDSLGWVYFKKGMFVEALEELKKAIIKEKDPAIFDHLGDVYEKLGSADMAVDAWRKALSLDATMVEVQAKISRVEKLLKKK